MPEAQVLNLKNDNNCLECDAFIKINVAPKNNLIESDFDKLYLVKHNEKDIYIKLVDILIVDFGKVSSIMTLPATGMQSWEWRKYWRENKPGISEETKMAVYYYRREKI